MGRGALLRHLIWHVPLIKLLDASRAAFDGGPSLADLALLKLLTLLLAALGVRYVERPAMQLQRSLSGGQPARRPHATDETRLALPNQAPRA